jgi:signal transduction histidine kinase
VKILVLRRLSPGFPAAVLARLPADKRPHLVLAIEFAQFSLCAFLIPQTEHKWSTRFTLRQAQKLESLGLLAGGVAHDFNNLLTGIMGNASLMLETVEQGSRSRVMLQNVITASERAAQLTRQLLTYAGKDQGKLKPLDVAAAVTELVPLLSASILGVIRAAIGQGQAFPEQREPVGERSVGGMASEHHRVIAVGSVCHGDSGAQ